MKQPELKCEVCEKVFKRKFSMKRHLKAVHLGEKDYKCDCGRRFVAKDQLSRHIISKHTQEKPYMCEKGCEKCYSTKMARSYHHKTFHENKKFSCNYLGCGRNFTSLKNLRTHTLKPHEFSIKSLIEKLEQKQKKILKLQKKIKQLDKLVKDYKLKLPK